ncbi:Fructose-1-phosphate phosphatase YqaB [Pontiella desulfatans]|uniref:Fructose-1-phosphate phosphatase YqaB n=1 Tax=Pontiella desulfatans TaxID=2750659 RepID=A0A6C2TYZ6_PONDE|nr:HAD family phosphatase [Pontiella desulfatans]VGO12938.1 Fructose-1-phosphate phosphatase YqaB [Pontiella desulfatans]
MDRAYGLIFDVDGVIADTERVNAEASIKVFEDLFGVRGVVRSDFEAGLGRGAAEYVRAAARIHGVELEDGQVEAATLARQEYFIAMLKAQPLPAFPGVLELMDSALVRDDFRVGIATSSTREKSEAVLKSAQVFYGQMAYVTGSDVTKKKPDPELFLKAAELLGLPPERCVVVEDAPDGVAAAKAAGCRCVAVTNSARADRLSDADCIVESLMELDLDQLSGLIDKK